MLFNSFTFAFFFLIVYTLYLFLQRNLKRQNRMLLVASCIFYGWWDWRFLGLLFFSITVDYFCAFEIERSRAKSRKKVFLLVSLISNLGILGFF